MHKKLNISALLVIALLSSPARAADRPVVGSESLQKLPLSKLETLAATGDANAKVLLGYRYFTGDQVPMDRSKALSYYHEAAELGSATAMGNICNMYHYGIGVPRSERTAFEWCQRSARLGNPDAMVMIAEIVQVSDGPFMGQPELARNTYSFQFYEMAAQREHMVGQYMLGVCYERGIGTEKDVAAALSSYKAAADKGYEPAIAAVKRLQR